MMDPRAQGAAPAMMQPGMPMPMDPGAPPTAPGQMAPETLDGSQEMASPDFVSTDPAQMAALAMQIIGEMAQMDQAKLEQQISQLVAQFTAQQEQAIATVPQIIAQMVAQIAGAGPDLATLDGPATTMPIEEMAPDQMGMVG